MPQRFEDPAFAEGREEVVHLPGGCTISGKQYAELQTFMEAPSIDKWWVLSGERVGVAGKGWRLGRVRMKGRGDNRREGRDGKWEFRKKKKKKRVQHR